jgi:hypothetical protein
MLMKVAAIGVLGASMAMRRAVRTSRTQGEVASSVELMSLPGIAMVKH